MYKEVLLFFGNFIDSISLDLDPVSHESLHLTLPHVPTSFLIPFLKVTKKQFILEPTLIELKGSFVIMEIFMDKFSICGEFFKLFNTQIVLSFHFLVIWLTELLPYHFQVLTCFTPG
jgi:hypothetical protein